MDEESLLRKILAGELHYAKLWLVCVALRGVSWDKMPFEQRELAFQAKDAAFNCLSIFLNSTAYRYVTLLELSRQILSRSCYRAALRYAVHDSLVTLAFSGLFLLKMANLFPTELDLTAIMSQVEQLAQLLSDVAAERSVYVVVVLRKCLSNTWSAQSCTHAANHACKPPPQSRHAPRNRRTNPEFTSPVTARGYGWPVRRHTCRGPTSVDDGRTWFFLAG